MMKKKKQDLGKAKEILLPAGNSVQNPMGQAKAKMHTWVDDVDWFGEKSSFAKSGF